MSVPTAAFSSPTIGGGAYIPGQSGIPTYPLIPANNGIGDMGQVIMASDKMVNVGTTAYVSPVEFSGEGYYPKNSQEVFEVHTLVWVDREYPYIPGKTCLMSLSHINHRLRDAYKKLRSKDAREDLDMYVDSVISTKFNRFADESDVDSFINYIMRRGYNLHTKEALLENDTRFIFTHPDPAKMIVADSELLELIALNIPGYIYNRYSFFGAVQGSKTGEFPGTSSDFSLAIGTHRYVRAFDYWGGCASGDSQRGIETQVGAALGFIIRPKDVGDATCLQLVPWSSCSEAPMPLLKDKMITYCGRHFVSCVYDIGVSAEPPTLNATPSLCADLGDCDLDNAYRAIGRIAHGKHTMNVLFRHRTPHYARNFY